LDTLLHERGLFASRSRAAASVMAGEVRVGPGGDRAVKPGQLVRDDVVVAVDERPRFVSRGGVKLANALAALGVDVAGRQCLDVGASTGGFTDCLLQAGAEHVVAYDVAYGELDWSLRTDGRVTVIERTNARRMSPDELPYAPDLVVADVSFISLTKVLPAVLATAAPRFDALTMVKPQFEVGRDKIGSGGVVRAAEDRVAALVDVARSARDASPAPRATASPSCGWPSATVPARWTTTGSWPRLRPPSARCRNDAADRDRAHARAARPDGDGTGVSAPRRDRRGLRPALRP
jgi:23S rRNA (cytidine1920-2'-O)/16S rRNA (cytidine1409-2'-O)-methyltransferase